MPFFQDTAEEWDESGYWDAIFRYLKNPESKLLYSVLQVKIEEFVEDHEDPIEAKDDANKYIATLLVGDLQTWDELREELSSLFEKDLELEIIFIETAKKVGVPLRTNIEQFL